MNNILKESWTIAIRSIKKSFSLSKLLIALFVTIILIGGIGFGVDSIMDFKKYFMNYTLFLASGYIAFTIAVTSLNNATSLLEDKKGFLKLLLVAPISRISIFFGTLINTWINSISGFILILALIFSIFFKTFSLFNLFMILISIILISSLFLGLGFIIVALVTKKENMQLSTEIIFFILMLASGLFYPISSIPKILQNIVYFNPLTYCIDLFRYSMASQNSIPLYLDFLIIIPLAILLPLIGIYLLDYKLRKSN